MKPEEKKSITTVPLEAKIRETISQTVRELVETPIKNIGEEHQKTISELLKDKQVIVYSNRLYISLHSGNKLLWIKDYYLYKSGKTDDYSTSFHVDINKKHFINYSESADDEYKNKLFYGFLNSVKIINDTSDENLGKIHLELLKTRLFNKVIPSISKDEILSREEYHRAKILKDINTYIEKISSHLYKMADAGIQTLRICFDDINEKTITNDGKVPPFKEYPCSDNVVRDKFNDYFYFILEKVFKKEADDISEQDWMGLHLVKKCAGIYPHLKFSYEASNSLLPIVKLNLNIDTMKVWL